MQARDKIPDGQKDANGTYYTDYTGIMSIGWNADKYGDINNLQPGLDFFKKLQEAGNLTTVDVTNGTIDSGQTGVVFDWTYNQASYKKELKDKGVNWKYKTFPKAQVVSYYNQAINKDAPHPAAAKAAGPSATSASPLSSAMAKHRQELGTLATTLPFFAYTACFLLAPTVIVIIGAFQNRSGGFTLANFNKMFEANAIAAFGTSILVSLASSLIGAVVGALASYALVIGAKPNGPLRRMVSAISSVLAQFGGVMLAFAFIATLGINGIGTMLIKTLTGYTVNPNWLSSLPGLVTVYCYFQIPLMIIIFLPAVDSIRPQWREACESLGGNTVQYWTRVACPILAPRFISAFLLLFASAFSAYATAAPASPAIPAAVSSTAEDAFKNDPTATLEGVRGKDVTKAAKALLKDSAKRGGGSIQMRDVVKIYPGSTVHALDDFNLDIKPGEMVVLLGGSGCGKSTALRSLAGLEDIQGGRIMVGGQDVTGVPVNKREMAMVFQAYSLFPHMTALENVEFGLEVRGTGKAECRKIAMEQLELVGLADQAKKYTQQMSGGQQQRVALARALAVKPRVLLLDEPLSTLAC